MRAEVFNKKTAFSVILILMMMVSYGGVTQYQAVDRTTDGDPVSAQRTLSTGTDLYIEEDKVCYIEAWSGNQTSEGIDKTAPIVGVPDGNPMEIDFVTEFEYALFKINGSIMSDTTVLRGFEDTGGADTIFELYGWNDPYTAPDLDNVNSTFVSGKDWFLLGMNEGLQGDVILTYENSSIEYLLLIARTAILNPAYYLAIDAIEVQGFTNVMADLENDGVPDIWQDSNIERYNMSLDIDIHGGIFGIMGLVGVAPEGVTNHDFLMPFVKLGVIDANDIDETHYYIICQTELTLPFVGAYQYMSFLGSYDLLNMTFIDGNFTVQSETINAFSRYIAHDNRIRNYHIIDYTVDGTFDPHDYYGSQNQIYAEYNTLDTKSVSTKTSHEKFDLDVSIVLDIVENVLDAVKAGKDMSDQFMSKIIGFIQGKIIDGVSKALLAKITKKALKSALKVILSVTTIKDIVVKGSKILEKLGISLPSWLKKARDWVESIPVIDPPVEIWKVRLTFLNDTTGVPILGYDYINNKTIDTHPKGLYFGDTYSAQIILSSRDIFPVVGRIQSVNGSRTLTGNLYVEDFGLQEATRAKSSLEPGEYAKGRIYPIPPDDSLVISQCHITLNSPPVSTVEIGTKFNISLAVKDENGTALTDTSVAIGAINNMPSSMVKLPITAEPDGNFTLLVDTGTIGIKPDDHMIAFVYKTDTMFHDYWNCTFVLQDTTAPVITNVTATRSSEGDSLVFSAKVFDYDLNTTSVLLKVIDGSTDIDLATTYAMTSNGTHYVVSVDTAEFESGEINFLVVAKDNSGNSAQSTLKSLNLQESPQIPSQLYLMAIGGTVAVVVVIYMVRRLRG